MKKNEISQYAKQAKLIQKDEFIFDLVKDRLVLDVGCIGQDRIFTSPDWLHNKLRTRAQAVDGVDILEAEVLKLKSEGYSMFTVKELEQTQNRYQVVLMSDVIEHVNDPVSFLSFYATFLSNDGRVFISTPNSNRSNNFIHILFNNNYSVNEEHTFWFCPRTMAEVVDRAGLEIEKFYWADHYYDSRKIKGLYQKFKFGLINLLKNFRSNFSPNMIFVVKRK